MAETTEGRVEPASVMTPRSGGFTLVTLAMAILPLILLGLVIALFINTSAGLDLSAPVPIETLVIERFVLEPGYIRAEVQNSGPEALTLAQIFVNDSTWPATAYPSNVIPRLGRATVTLQYPWVEGEAYALKFLTSNAIAFHGEIPVAFTTPTPTGNLLLSFTLIGIYVGIIPVALGLLWYPALRQLGRRAMMFLLALTVGLLIFLGVDSLAEALEQAARVPSPLQGLGLVGLGSVGAFLLLWAVSARQTGIQRTDVARRLSLAYMIALGIGIHNLGEGLAIGAAYSVGEVALGAFLVIGFIVQNITEGLAIIAPILRDRPPLRHLLLMGLLAGAPAILGSWIGGFPSSVVAATLFLAIGAGAIFQVAFEIGKMLLRDNEKTPAPFLTFAGVMAGMLVMYVTGVLVK
jgi:zinc transporter, ZIP family